MNSSDLDYILANIPSSDVNVYDSSAEKSIMGNYVRAAKDLGLPHRLKKNHHGKRFVRLEREDGTLLGNIAPALLPTCNTETRAICNSKIRTTNILEAKGVRVPRSRVIAEGEEELALTTCFEQADEVAVKAHSMSLGRGIHLNVTPESFIEEFRACIALQKSRKHAPQAIVQEMVKGFEMRVTVIEGAVDNVLVRIPAYVTGDGTSTIRELIGTKNDARAKCGYFGNKPIKIEGNVEAYTRARGIDLESSPTRGQHVLLSAISNAAYGGETAIVSDVVSEAVKEEALRSVAAIPGLATAGVDVMASSFEEEDPVILEVNAFPHAQLSVYPYFGESTDPISRYLKAILVRDSIMNGGQGDARNIVTLGETISIVERYMRFYELRDSLQLAAA